MPADLARDALSKIDEALAARPLKDGHVLAAALERLCAYRDALRGRSRAGSGPDDAALFDTLNATISVVMGCQFPLGEVPWTDLEAARGWLADLVDRQRSAGE